MNPSKIVETFTDRYPLVGPFIWTLSIQYYIIQFVVAQAWKNPYSLTHNTISDLGNSACGLYSGAFVCSPLHILMNASFITLGITMALGSMLIYQEFKESDYTFVGFSLMALAGIGTILVGLFPENTVSILHIIGAALPFLLGNLCLILLGFALNMPRVLKIYTLCSGFVALIALFFFITHHYLGLGIGGMERLTAYPQTIWLIVFGIYISKNHISKRSIVHKL